MFCTFLRHIKTWFIVLTKLKSCRWLSDNMFFCTKKRWCHNLEKNEVWKVMFITFALCAWERPTNKHHNWSDVTPVVERLILPQLWEKLCYGMAIKKVKPHNDGFIHLEQMLERHINAWGVTQTVAWGNQFSAITPEGQPSQLEFYLTDG